MTEGFDNARPLDPGVVAIGDVVFSLSSGTARLVSKVMRREGGQGTSRVTPVVA